MALASVLTGCGNQGQKAPAQSTHAATSSTTAAPSVTADGYAFNYQPLWPFSALEEADKWLRDSKHTGESAWHADPAATASKFTREFLGFTDLSLTTTVNEQAREAWVGVGQNDPTGTPVTVATLHLARLGPAADAPWEVVGTQDLDLSLDTPKYGSPLPRPVIDAGGTISGVDESLELKALQPNIVLGEFCCVPAGGVRSRWTAAVQVVTDPRPGPVTVVVWTGGQYAHSERFAITGVIAP